MNTIIYFPPRVKAHCCWTASCWWWCTPWLWFQVTPLQVWAVSDVDGARGEVTRLGEEFKQHPFWIRPVVLPAPAHALNKLLKQEFELENMQSSTSVSIRLLCSFLQPEFGDFLASNCILIISFNSHYLVLFSINLSNLPMSLFIFQSL